MSYCYCSRKSGVNNVMTSWFVLWVFSCLNIPQLNEAEKVITVSCTK